MIFPFKGNFRQSQDWNDKRFRASYAKYNILGHNGEDYATPTGTPIIAPHPGKILEAQFDSGYGWYVKIEDSKQGSVLAHLSRIDVKVGQFVAEGQQIGLSGNSGNSTGPHLHWGYYRIPRNRDNGFLGYIDQNPDWFISTNSSDFQKKYEEEREKVKKLHADKVTLLNINQEVKPILEGVIKKLKTE